MYKVQSTERNSAAASEYETKAMLYLMCFHNDGSQIKWFVVDFFNDVTGVNKLATKAWDIQSKANKNINAMSIGRFLVTLYKNYCSHLNFCDYIAFLGGVADTFRKTIKTTFDISNVNAKAYSSIVKGLISECSKKEYIDKKDVNEEQIKEFLKKVTFVIDDKEKVDYVKKIIEFNPIFISNDSVFSKIFDEIRKEQSFKKAKKVEGIIINDMTEFYRYNHHLKTEEIKLLVLNRIINNNLYNKGCPIPFSRLISMQNEEDQKDIIDDCQNNISITLFDKNNTTNFWAFFANVYDVISKNKGCSIDETYDKIDRSLVDNLQNMDFMSIKYFIALMKDGIL